MRMLLACLAFAALCTVGVTSAFATPTNGYDPILSAPAPMCDQAIPGLASMPDLGDVCMLLTTEKVAFAGPAPKPERPSMVVLFWNCDCFVVDALRLPQTIPK